MYCAIAWVMLLLMAQASFGQRDTASVNRLLDKSKTLMNTDIEQAILVAKEAIKKAADIQYHEGEGLGYKNIGMIYYRKGEYLATLEYWNKSLESFEKSTDLGSQANMLSNLGAVYLNQGADAQALDYILRSLKIAEKINDTARMVNALSNIASTYYNKKDPVALTYLLKVLPMVETTGDTYQYVVVTGNIGEVYYDLHEFEKAEDYFRKSISAAANEIPTSFSLNGLGKISLAKNDIPLALKYHTEAMENSKKFDEKLELSRSYRNLANCYKMQGNAAMALNYLNLAKELAENMDDVKPELKFLYETMSKIYADKGDFRNAYTYGTKYAQLKDSLYNIESKLKLNQLQFDFELSKKETELSLQNERLKSEKQARIGITVTLSILLLGSILIYRSYLQKARINKVLDKQKEEIEGLLLNILPKEVAEELKDKGFSRPRHFDEVSVLFTDFIDFTNIADKMKPNTLVDELNECFVAFDKIIGKYGLEKIKTIGDSYMCAGNLPSMVPEHSYKIIKAAVEMQQFLYVWNENRISEGKNPWDVRMGIHIGPVVAGVVGMKKYAYDIWGSTVNIASRMESACLPGKINISENTYHQIKDRFTCVYRGKINAKNVGELDMYFVESEIHGEN
jgi:class 3 adenylate cyclase/Tfp pilus assembly protein PilF